MQISEYVTPSSVFAVFAALMAVVVLLERRSPTKTVAWLLVLAFLPFVGFVLYILFGRNLRKKRWVRGKGPIDYSVVEDVVERYIDSVLSDKTVSAVLGTKDRLMYLLIQSADAPLTVNNRLRVLKDAHEKYPVLFEMIEGAVDHIHLEYYIIRDDAVGRRLVNLLVKKAREGVEVRLLFDAVGSSGFSRKNRRQLEQAGVQVGVFLPVWVPFLNSRVNYRNHRKLAVVDGTRALVGGINIGEEYLGKNPQMGYWRDTQLLIEGDGVNSLQLIFLMDWYFATKENFSMEKYFFKNEVLPDNHYVQIAASGPDTHWESIHQMYFSIISTAEDSLYITSPYFIPDDSIMMALKTAALSGVDVRLIIPGKPDYKVIHWASHSYLEEVMEAGVRVYQYKKGFVHAKVLISDGVIASVGTANMDPRSFHHNFEVNAFVYSREVVEDIEYQFFQDISDSEELILELYRRKPLPRKLGESTARLLSPIL